MEWDKKIPSRLNRRAIPKSSHLTGQVGQADSHGLRNWQLRGGGMLVVVVCGLFVGAVAEDRWGIEDRFAMI